MQGPIETRSFPKASPNFYSLAGLTRWKGQAKSEEKQLLKLSGLTPAPPRLHKSEDSAMFVTKICIQLEVHDAWILYSRKQQVALPMNAIVQSLEKFIQLDLS